MFSIFKRKPSAPAALPFATDIHCHVVPGVDDGSPDAATSAELIERMQQWGIRRIIASPHVTQNTFENSRDTLGPAMEALHAELGKRGNAIDVSHAAEYRIDDLFKQRLDRNDLFLLPGKYILIENSFLQEPWGLDQLIFDLQVKGLHPILAHPERYAYYHRHHSRYRELHDRGLDFQINLLSLAGAYGPEEKKTALRLLADGLVDYIGTDLHKASHADRIDAYLRTADARAHMADAAGTIRNDIDFPADTL